MGQCCTKSKTKTTSKPAPAPVLQPQPLSSNTSQSTPAHSFSSPWPSPYPSGIPPTPSPVRTPRRRMKWPFPPPSPAKPILSGLVRQRRVKKEEGDGSGELDKRFGYSKSFGRRFELGKEVGRGHFGHTCFAKGKKKGEFMNLHVAVKIISKAKMTSAIAIEDVRREVKILKALSGHVNLIKFYEAFEDSHNVYIVMELCEGGELLDRILSRGGRYTEEDAKPIIIQILKAVAFCHLQGVVHRDLKPENFLFSTKDENAQMKVIDFGLSDFTRPDQRLTDIVGSAYYVAPEVLHRSYSIEADVWSIGVIVYILLCGSRPFYARTESGIFRSVLRADPNFEDPPWPTISAEAKDFVRRLLNKDHRKRMTASQALTHPWLRDESLVVPIDISIYKLVTSYLCATPLKRAALKALSKALPEDEILFLSAQFKLLEPKDGRVSLENFRAALTKTATDAMKESRVPDILNVMDPLAYKMMEFEEFCAAAISIYQLEALDGWEKIASTAYKYFEEEGNRTISADELILEMNLGASAYTIIKDWIRFSDRKLSFLGYTKFLHGVTIRSSNTRHQ